MERDVKSKFSGICTLDFNSHAHVERDAYLHPPVHCVWNFNSHAHVERDIVETNAFINPKISTHTLTWSVTP